MKTKRGKQANVPRTVVMILVALSAFVSAAHAELLLVDNGQPRAVIVVSSNASDQAREAAPYSNDSGLIAVQWKEKWTQWEC